MGPSRCCGKAAVPAANFPLSTSLCGAMSTTPRLPALKSRVIARSESEDAYHYLYPAGSGDERAALEAIVQDARSAGRKLVIFSVTPDAAGRMEGWFPGLFHFEDVRDDADYLYDARETGRTARPQVPEKTQPLFRFERDNPDWRSTPLRRTRCPRCAGSTTSGASCTTTGMMRVLPMSTGPSNWCFSITVSWGSRAAISPPAGGSWPFPLAVR